MELYHNNMSVCAQKVRMVIAEKRLNPVMHHKYLRNGDTHTPEYLALNPNGVVPTLIDGGVPIIESTIICEYLEDAYPEHSMRPDDPLALARMRLWTQLVDTSIHHACGRLSVAVAWRHQILAQPEGQLKTRANDKVFMDLVHRGPESEAVRDALLAFHKLIGRMSTALQKAPWLTGDQFTLADNAMVPYIVRLDHLDMAWMWDKHPALADWYARAQTREAFRGISDYLEPEYVALTREKGAEARDLLRSSLAAMV